MLKHISEILNGESLWKGLIEIKPPGTGEMQTKTNGSFLIKRRL